MIWAEYRQLQPEAEQAGARRELIRRHVRESEWPADLEKVLVEAAAEARAGHPLTPDRIGALARRIAGYTPEHGRRLVLTEQQTRRLAEAAVAEAHPVVRAAHLFAECVGLFADEDGRPAAPVLAHPLPWMLASLSLLRSNFPPLVMDHRVLPAMAVSWAEPTPGDRVVHLASVLCLLVVAALRGELSRVVSVPGQRTPGTPPLAMAVQRRIAEHLRYRKETLTMLLQTMDGDTRTNITTGDADDPTARAHRDASAAHALFAPGTRYWWTSLDISMSDASLRLFVIVQDVGSPACGVLAVTADAWLTTAAGARDALDLATTDCVTVMPADSVDDRWPQVRDLLDDVVSRSMDQLTRV